MLALYVAFAHLIVGLYFSVALGAPEPAVALYCAGSIWTGAALSEIDRDEEEAGK